MALRDLGSILAPPSTLGSLASNCKANYLGVGDSCVGGEVTGIKGGATGALGAWKMGQRPLPALRLHPRPGSTGGRAPLQPLPTPGPGTQRSRAGGGGANVDERDVGRRGR